MSRLRLDMKDVPQPIMLSGGELMPHQKKGLSWLVALRSLKLNGLLADEMGTSQGNSEILPHFDIYESRQCIGFSHCIGFKFLIH